MSNKVRVNKLSYLVTKIQAYFGRRNGTESPLFVLLPEGFRHEQHELLQFLF